MPPEHTISLGLTAEVLAAEYSIAREAQDAFALASYERALAAQQMARFDGEIVPAPRVDAEPVTVDEGSRPETSLDRLATLRPVFASDATVTEQHQHRGPRRLRHVR